MLVFVGQTNKHNFRLGGLRRKADKYYLELVYESGDVSRIEVTDLSALRGDSGSKGDKGDNGNGIAEIITKITEPKPK